MAKIEEKVTNLLEPIITNLNYELYDVEYAKEGKDYYLRIFIDSPKGIDLNDCEKVNNAITDILDEADYIKDQYFLEVSSPGVERILRKDKHLKQNIGNKINIKLFQKDESGCKEYTGILKDFDENEILVEVQKNQNKKSKNKKLKEEQNLKETKNSEIENDLQIKINRKNIAQIKTVFDWKNI